MAYESYSSNVEQLAWGQQLSDTVRQQGQLLREHEAGGNFGSHGLKAPDGTMIGLATFPINLETRDSYVPLLGHRMVKRTYDLPGFDGARYYHSMHQAHDVPGVQPEERPRLSFVVETEPDAQGVPTYAVSSSGEIESPVKAAHYEGFVDPDGIFVGLYKLGKGQQLEPVDDVEGERLLWQMGNSQLV